MTTTATVNSSMTTITEVNKSNFFGFVLTLQSYPHICSGTSGPPGPFIPCGEREDAERVRQEVILRLAAVVQDQRGRAR